MSHPKYSLVFDFRGQKLRLTIFRLFRMFKWSVSLTKLEKVSNGNAREGSAKERNEER